MAKKGETKRREKKPATPEGVRLRLAGLCARSEQCENDLRQKIARTGLSKDDSDAIIEFLRDNKYLDEHRFARAYCMDKVRFAGWGIMKIRQGLMAKRVPPAIISEAIGEIDRKEYIAALKRVGIAKARTLDLHTADDRGKFYRYMAARGFEASLISRLQAAILKKLDSE